MCAFPVLKFFCHFGFDVRDRHRHESAKVIKHRHDIGKGHQLEKKSYGLQPIWAWMCGRELASTDTRDQACTYFWTHVCVASSSHSFAVSKVKRRKHEDNMALNTDEVLRIFLAYGTGRKSSRWNGERSKATHQAIDRSWEVSDQSDQRLQSIGTLILFYTFSD